MMDVNFFWALRLLALSACTHAVSANIRVDTSRLKKDLFANYSNDLLPVMNHTDVVVVSMAFILIAVQRLSMKTQALKTNAWLVLKWYDEMLQWDPSKYRGVEEIYVYKPQVWIPPIQVDNPINKIILGGDRMGILVDYTGRILFQPGVIMETMCPVDISKYPFDTQACEVNLLSFVYPSQSLVLQPVFEEVSLSQLIPNGEWNVEDFVASMTSFKSIHGEGSHSAVTEKVFLKRRSFFYIMNTVIPLILLSTLNMLVFTLPADCGERMTVAVSALLAFTIYLDIISEDIPQTSEQVSILTVYCTLQLGLSTASVITAGLVLNIHYCSATHEIPRQLSWLYTYLFTIENPADIKNRQIKSKLTGLDIKVKEKLKEVASVARASSEKENVTKSDVREPVSTEQDERVATEGTVSPEHEKNESVKAVAKSVSELNFHIRKPGSRTSQRALLNSLGDEISIAPVDQVQKPERAMSTCSSGSGRTSKRISPELMRHFLAEITRLMDEEREKNIYSNVTWHDIGTALDSFMFWLFVIATNALTATVLNMLLS